MPKSASFQPVVMFTVDPEAIVVRSLILYKIINEIVRDPESKYATCKKIATSTMTIYHE